MFVSYRDSVCVSNVCLCVCVTDVCLCVCGSALISPADSRGMSSHKEMDLWPLPAYTERAYVCVCVCVCGARMCDQVS